MTVVAWFIENKSRVVRIIVLMKGCVRDRNVKIFNYMSWLCNWNMVY